MEFQPVKIINCYKIKNICFLHYEWDPFFVSRQECNGAIIFEPELRSGDGMEAWGKRSALPFSFLFPLQSRRNEKEHSGFREAEKVQKCKTEGEERLCACSKWECDCVNECVRNEEEWGVGEGGKGYSFFLLCNDRRRRQRRLIASNDSDRSSASRLLIKASKATDLARSNTSRAQFDVDFRGCVKIMG